MTDPQKMMGFQTEADRRVTIPVRHWDAAKLALWRSRMAWQIAEHAAAELLAHCKHVDDCLGKESETEPCASNCPDRETRLSALVILNAARQFAPVDARKPAEAPYFAPTREYFSEVLAELLTAQTELEALHSQGFTATPTPQAESALATKPQPQLTNPEPPKLQEAK